MDNFYSLSPDKVKGILENHGYSPVHFKPIYQYFYRADADQEKILANLPRKLLDHFKNVYSFPQINIAKEFQSKYDASVKFLLKLDDEQLVEAVLMPERSRITLCISSQVGCRQACSFCHTGRMGLTRNLEAGEIIGQVVAANQWLSMHPSWLKLVDLPIAQRVSNVVFMGMGEPLDNVPEVTTALKIMLNPQGLNIAPRRITVSTAGHLDGLKALINENLGVGIALSLHVPDSQERSRIMPINRRYPLTEVLDYLKVAPIPKNRHFLIQYTVIAGVNDSIEHAKKLARLLNGINAKVNLIPLNSFDTTSFKQPDPDDLYAFQGHLLLSGIRSMIRFSKGQDIEAACGQLALSSQ